MSDNFQDAPKPTGLTSEASSYYWTSYIPVIKDAVGEWSTLFADRAAESSVTLIKELCQKIKLDTDKLYADALTLPWNKPLGIPRSICWLTQSACSCVYSYGRKIKVTSKLHPYPQWLVDLTQLIQMATGLEVKFNAVNVNRSDSGSQSCGWHADGEALFRNATGVYIISLSIGQSRCFELRKNFTGAPKHIILDDGDLLWMSGACQRYYQHRVPSDPDRPGDRINFTWRVISNHQRGCRSRNLS